MDKIIKQSKWEKNRKWFVVIGIVAFLASVLIWSFSGVGVLKIEKDKIRTGQVVYGDFQEIVLATGSIASKSTVLVDANEGGTVQEIRVEEGSMVTAGDILVVLKNEALMLDYMQRETQIVEQINNLRNTRINLHQNLRSTEDQLIDFEKELITVKKQYLVDSSLYLSNGIAKNVLEESRLNYRYISKKVETLSARANDDQKYHGQQISRIDNSILLMERNLELIREKLTEMSVKAPLSGQLNSFDLEPGQVLRPNETIGRVDVPGKYWIRALVDQHYLNRLNEGQGAHIEYDGTSYELTVSKVLSTVENGQIEMYLDFLTEPPTDLRRGQNFQVYVEVSAKNNSLKVPKGSFFQSSGGKYVYVISPDGKYAEKRTVKLGRQNPDYYEVLEGLDEGVEIVISSYDYFNQADKIELIN